MSIFSSISQPHYPNAALGIEYDVITAVALEGNKRQYSIRQAATVEVPEGLIAPSFLDVNIADKPAFATCLREVVETAGMLNQKRWSVALPSNTARSAIISLESEPANRQEAEEVIDWKAEQSFGAPAMELRIARHKISPDREGRSRYFVTAVKLAVIDEYETQFEALGWKAGLILPRAVSEANWLIDANGQSDSLLISGNLDGFTALLMRGDEPAVVRSVTCSPAEVEDEIYRLVMFYNDRFGGEQDGLLDRLLVVGRSVLPAKVQEIASEALGRRISVLSNDEVGLNVPAGGFSFDDLAAPAGLAALGA
jgi:Tfp pilus assembly PilM family ATPase